MTVPLVRQLPLRPVRGDAGPAWWVLGCHGGAGASTLAAAVGGLDAGRYWPQPQPPGTSRVVLVARDHAAGLRAAQAAARQWASGQTGATLLGLAVVASAPGKRPKPLRELLQLVSGGMPRVWELPWVESLRLGDPVDRSALPHPFEQLATDLDDLTPDLPGTSGDTHARPGDHHTGQRAGSRSDAATG